MGRYYGREHFEAVTRPPFELSEWPPWDYTEEDHDSEKNSKEQLTLAAHMSRVLVQPCPAAGRVVHRD